MAVLINPDKHGFLPLKKRVELLQTVCADVPNAIVEAHNGLLADYARLKAADAVVLTAHNTLKQCGLKPDCIALVCMNARGETAGACNHKGFSYACAREGEAPRVVEVAPVIDKDEE